MNEMMKKVISFVLCFVLAAGCLPVGAFAAEVTVDFAGTADTEGTVFPTQLVVTGENTYAMGDTYIAPQVSVKYSDGTSEDLTEDQYTVAGTVNTDVAGSYTLNYNCTVNGYAAAAEFVVTVQEEAAPVADEAVTVTFELENMDIVSVTGLGLTGITVTWDDTAAESEAVAHAFGVANPSVYNIALDGYTPGEAVEITMEVGFITAENLALYHYDNGVLSAVAVTSAETVVVDEVTYYTVLTFTTNHVGTFVVGNPVAANIPGEAVLSGIEVSALPEKLNYFIDLDATAEDELYLDITGLVVNAIYTKDGESYPKPLEWDRFKPEEYDGYRLTMESLTTAGVKTVTVTYGGYATTFTVNVYEEYFEVDGIKIQLTVPHAAEVTVVNNTDAEFVRNAMDKLELDNFVAYDISLTGHTRGEEVHVTLPVPADITNPAIFYIPEDGGHPVRYMGHYDTENGAFTFTTDHFSTWVVADETTQAAAKTVENFQGTVPDTQERDVYVPVGSIDEAGDYLIASGNYETVILLSAASSGIANHTAAVIEAKTVDGTAVTYIEKPNDTSVWTANENNNGTYTLYNGTLRRYLSRSNYGGLTTDDSGYNWTAGNGRLYYDGQNRDYYIYWSASSGWQLSNADHIVQIFQKQKLNLITGGYITGAVTLDAGEDRTVVYDTANTEVTIDPAILVDGEDFTQSFEKLYGDDTTNGWYSYSVLRDDNGVLVETEVTDGTFTLNPKSGEATVRVYYSWVDDGSTYTVYDDVTITSTGPYYYIEILEDASTPAGDVISYRGVTGSMDVPLLYRVMYVTASGTTQMEPTYVRDHIFWSKISGGDDIASLSMTDSKLHLTGKEGTVQIQVAYEVDANTTVTDIVTINIRKDTAVTPDDSTSDFPRWPNEGAVRFDKTSTAVGNFSETGIAQVELSMAGIPVTTGGAVDVVLVVDLSTSMQNNGRLASAKAASKAFVESLASNPENRLAIVSFNANTQTTGKIEFAFNYLTNVNVGTANAAIENFSLANYTNYVAGLKQAQSILSQNKTEDRPQFLVFLSDGAPTRYLPVGAQNALDFTDGSGGAQDTWITNGTRSSQWQYEHYTTEMKEDGITVYTVGLGLSENYNQPQFILNDMSGPANEQEQPDGIGDATKNKLNTYYYEVPDANSANALKSVFSSIAEEISAAATNIEVEDAIGKGYSLIFELPSAFTDGDGESAADYGLENQEFYIEVVEYPLDETTHERTGVANVKQRIYLNGTTVSKVMTTKENAEGNPYLAEMTAAELELKYTAAKEGEKSYYDAQGNYVESGDGGYHMTSGVKVVAENGVLKYLHTPYFTYDATFDTEGKLVWTVTSMSPTAETALRYFVYLNNSGGADPEHQVEPGTYYTNKFANLNYTNHLGNECEQSFPVPQMTWNGAQVSYVFYLVNEDGVPVNRAGREVTFAEAVFVTGINTYSVVWNSMEQSAGLEASYVAQNLLPEAYTLYDPRASYTIHVYEDENGNNLNNHFVIDGSTQEMLNDAHPNRTAGTDASLTTTYVYNNKTDVRKFNEHGAYAANRVYLCKTYNVEVTEDEEGNIIAAQYTGSAADGIRVVAEDLYSLSGAKVFEGYAYYKDEYGQYYTIVMKEHANAASGFDFANTTVAFAVVWNKSLTEDVVVVDFGLPVEIDVTTNDLVSNVISGISTVAPIDGGSTVLINTGAYSKSSMTKNELSLGDDGQHRVVPTAGTETKITFTPGNQTSMIFNEPVDFYYETAVEAYENGKVVTSYLYSKVTVIPATTVYYEDSFLTVEGFNADGSENDSVWVGSVANSSGMQDADRPGESQITAALDADNVYGHDSHYANMTTYSMNGYRKAHVDANSYGTATFSFYGTGFDVISSTSNMTGTLAIAVVTDREVTIDGKTYNAGETVRSTIVDTYYGYTYGIYKVTYTLIDGKWVQTSVGDVSPVEVEGKYYLPDAEGNASETEVKVYDTKDELTATSKNGEPVTGYIKVWKAVENDHNALYQVPVMKITDLPYGPQYTVTITATYAAFFDHTKDDGYDLYLDAIRIYDPTGNLNDVANEAYKEDKEAFPVYQELRNLILGENTFTSIDGGDKLTYYIYTIVSIEAFETGVEYYTKNADGTYTLVIGDYDSNTTYYVRVEDSVAGLVFIDGNDATNSISDYTNYGPNNELYLAPGQAIAFNLDVPAGAADVQIGLKLANGANAAYEIYNAISGGAKMNVLSGTVMTTTDMYYSIKKQADNDTIVITNTGSGILSITNIKITFTEKPSETDATGLLSIDGVAATNAIKSLSYVTPSTANFIPENMDIRFNRTNAEVGNNIVVTVTTSSDVKDLIVNGKIATNKTTSYLTGETTWSFTVPVEDNGSLKVTVVGYDANGEYSVPYSESITVVNMSGDQSDLLGKLFG